MKSPTNTPYISSVKKLSHLLLASALLAGVLPMNPAHAASGIWTNLNGGSWAAAANWTNGVVASGSGNTADFSELTLSAAPTVTLDGAQTIGNLILGDMGNTYGWTLNTGSGGPLTLAASSGSPAITVNGQTTTLGLGLAGTQGLTKAGNGTLVLSANNTYTGGTLINGGVVQVTGITGTLGSGTTGSVDLNGGTLAALFPSTTSTTPAWPINVDTNGGTIALLQTGNNGRWFFTPNTLTGTGTLTIKPAGTRFQLFDQSVSGFSGKWVIDGASRSPAASAGFVYMGVVSADVCFGAVPASFTPDAITLIHEGVLVNDNAAGCQIGSPTRGITIGPGGGEITVGGARNFVVNSPISGITGDPVYYAANNNGAGVQLNQACTYNGNTVIYNYVGSASTVYLRLGANDVLPYGPGMGLATFYGSVTTGKAVLDLNGFNATINGFGANTAYSVVDVMTGGGSSILTVGSADTSSSFGGAIQNTSGTLSLAKIGAGTLTLTGTNTYAGSTTVSGGQLVISTAGQQAGGSFSVADGATLGVNVSSSALTLPTSALTLGTTAGATLALNFSGTPSSTVAPITATNLTANAVTLNVNFGGGVAVGQYPLIQYAAGGLGGAGYGAFSLATTPTAMTALLVNNTANNSIDVKVTVAPSITVTLTSSTNPAVLGQPVTFTATATVAGSNGTGTVTFKNGTATLGSAILNSAGMASLTTSFATVGVDSITATYSGTTSLPLSLTVNPGLLIWSGAKNSTWDINTTTNWLNLGLPGTYYDSDAVQFDDTATGSTAISLGVTVNPASVIASNNTKAYSLSGAGSIAGTAGLTKLGTGTLALSNTNTYTGNTVVSNGVLTFSGGGSYTGNGVPGALYVGGGSGEAILNMNSTGLIAFGKYASLGGITGDSSDTGSGALYQTAGSLNANSISGGAGFVALPLEIGAGGPSAYGFYSLSGGTLNTLPLNSTAAASLRVGAIGLGVFLQTGGTLNDGGYLDVGSYSGSSGNGGNGVATFTGGSANISSTTLLGSQPGGSAVMNLGAAAGGAATVHGSSVDLLSGSTASSGVLNLNSGVLQLTGSIYKNTANSVGTDAVCLNGGTLQAGANNLTLLGASLDNVLLFNGGVVIDTQTNTETETVSLTPASGNGFYPVGGTLAIASGGGSGYIGAPLVTVSGGSGTNAFAIANVAGGVVTGVTLTCPGINYVAGDVLSFAFAGGGATTPANPFHYTLKAADVAPNSAGGLTKLGAGTLILNGYNTYTNTTTVKNGTLEMDGYIASGVIVTGGMLDGYSSIGGPVTVQSGGALGAGTSAGIGTLTLASSLSLAGTASFRLDKTGGVLQSDNIQGIIGVTYGGALDVTNITSDASLLALGDKVTLFGSTAYSGGFTTFNLPALPSGLAWSVSGLTVDGSIQVVAVSTTPPTITHVLNGRNFNLSWPADHIGWRLLVQTNNLAAGVSTNVTDWGTVAGSATTNEVAIPIDATKPAEFYRLIYP